MKNKKVLSTLAVTLIMISAFSTTAFAAGHGGGHHSKSSTTANKANYAFCNLADCPLTGNHKHDGVTYAAHNYNDGHEYHDDNHWTGDGHNNHNSGNHH